MTQVAPRYPVYTYRCSLALKMNHMLFFLMMVSAVFTWQGALAADAAIKAGTIVADDSNGVWFDRSLEVRGIQIVVAGAVGGQKPVPNKWVEKTAQTLKLLIDPSAPNIDKAAQKRLVATLEGALGTSHQGYQTGQRIGYGGGDSYRPNPLRDNGVRRYKGYEAWLDRMVHKDMVWYKNVDSSHTGDDDIVELLEHLMHTIHSFGLPGVVDGSLDALSWDPERRRDYHKQELWLAMKEAINNRVFNVSDYGNGDPRGHMSVVMMTEYMYLLNFSMWGFGQEFWGDGGSLAPEWSNKARTAKGVRKHNPLGYRLFMTYFNPVLSKPDIKTLRRMFKNRDKGESGYVAE